jgi:hypothetical protein
LARLSSFSRDGGVWTVGALALELQLPAEQFLRSGGCGKNHGGRAVQLLGGPSLELEVLGGRRSSSGGGRLVGRRWTRPLRST